MNRTIYNRDWRRRNPEKCAKYHKKWRMNNPGKIRDRNRGKKQRRKAWLIQFKNKPCMDCGICYPHYVMDFDHRPGSEKDILTRSPQSSTGWARSMMFLAVSHPGRFENEVKKCDVVCANCHRVRTHERMDWSRRYDKDGECVQDHSSQLSLFEGV